MILTSIGKRFVYVSILFMTLSMVLPWESLSDYTYLESAGIMMNITPAIIFIVAVALVILKPLAEFFNRLGSNYNCLMLCFLNAIVLLFYM